MHYTYLQNNNIWEIQPTSTASWFWKCILKVRQYFINNVIKSPGPGTTIYIYKDPWIQGLSSFKLSQDLQPITFNTVDNFILLLGLELRGILLYFMI